MKFKNILTEAIVDNLNLSKLEKGILKTFNSIKDDKNYVTNRKGEISTTWDLSDGEKIIKVSDMIGFYDYDILVRLYKLYKKYGDILFQNFDENDKNLKIDFIKDESMLKPLMMMFYYKNYFHKTIEAGGFEWEFNVMGGSISEAILEESDFMELYLVGDNAPSVTVFCGFYPNKEMVGSDMITMDDDFAEYNASVKNKTQGGNSDYEEILGSKYLSIVVPKDMKESTLKNYFDTLIEKVKKQVIVPNVGIIRDYINQ